MKKLFSGKTIVGLEISQGSIRGIELTDRGGPLAVANFGMVQIPAGAVQEGMIMDPQAVTAALEELWQTCRFRTRDVITGVSNQGVVIRFALFPKVTPGRLDNLIRFQANEHLPVPLDTVYLDYDVIGSKRDGERELLEVLLVAGKKEMIDSLIRVLAAARLRPLEIEVLPLTLLRLLKQAGTGRVVAAVDIGENLSNMVIADALKPRLARMMITGLEAGLQQTAAASEEGDWPPTEQEANYLELINNIRATIGFYQSHKEARPVERVLVTGKIARLAQVAGQMEAELRLPVTLLRPLEVLKIRFNGANNPLTDYGLAMSLAYRGWE